MLTKSILNYPWLRPAVKVRLSRAGIKCNDDVKNLSAEAFAGLGKKGQKACLRIQKIILKNNTAGSEKIRIQTDGATRPVDTGRIPITGTNKSAFLQGYEDYMRDLNTKDVEALALETEGIKMHMSNPRYAEGRLHASIDTKTNTVTDLAGTENPRKVVNGVYAV